LTFLLASRYIYAFNQKENALVPNTEATLALVTRFENELNTRDVDALMADMTEDRVFEHVAPGSRLAEGAAAVRAVWASMDTHFPGFTREVVDLFAARDRACCRWVIGWNDAYGNDVALRGVDVITVRDGKIAEHLTYGSP